MKEMPLLSGPEHVGRLANNRQTNTYFMNHPCKSTSLNLLFYIHLYTITAHKGKKLLSMLSMF